MCQGLVVASLIPAIQLPQLASGQAVKRSIGQFNWTGKHEWRALDVKSGGCGTPPPTGSSGRIIRRSFRRECAS